MHLVRGLSALACLVAGAAVAVCAVALHDHLWGLLLGSVTTIACLVALPGGWWARLPFALGWAVVLWFATFERPEGDYLVSADVDGYVLLAFGMGVVVGGFVGLAPRRAAAEDSGPPGSSP